MIILQFLGWLTFSYILMSFIEHQVHSRLMHKRSIAMFEKTFKGHAINHHKHYSKIFTDEPVPKGEDTDIRMNVWKAPIKGIPYFLVISIFSWQCALVFVAVGTLHSWIWNQIHLEMHKPEGRPFSKWPIYKFLARYHWLHHRYQDKNFNVVFPFADYVLGTVAKPTAADLKLMEEQLEPQKVPQLETANSK